MINMVATTWDDPVVITNLAVSCATAFLALLTWSMSRATRRMAAQTQAEAVATGDLAEAARTQLALSQQQNEATRDALAISARQADEATRARVDARAPFLQVLLRHPSWPPFLEEPSVPTAPRAEPGLVFPDAESSGQSLWFRTDALVRNEGATTAIVTILPDARFSDLADFKVPPKTTQGRYALAPGAEAYLIIETSRTVGEFVQAMLHRPSDPPEGKMQTYLIVTDQLDDGIVDNIQLEVSAFPLEHAGGSDWRIRSDAFDRTEVNEVVGSAVWPIRRRYFVSKERNEEQRRGEIS